MTRNTKAYSSRGRTQTFVQDLGPVSLPHELPLYLTVSFSTVRSKPRREVHREHDEFLIPARPDAELAMAAVNRGRATACIRGVKKEHWVDAALKGRVGEGRKARTT